MEFKLKQHTEADEKFGITVNYLLNLASRAHELFESSKIEQKRQLINFLLSNLQLRGKKLEYKLKKPFDVLVNLQNCENRSVWLVTVDDVKARILLMNEEIFIPELALKI